ncbi:hypothetical protein [Aliarcobacter butzleri]|uniref:hypothetical protein n=1 Tax=Aliarcobacter butzleri TaxID=28197 RepID=UPI0021B3E9BA|nr:hypothetical protein [Aliarcobacter butzleri]MCT7646106.1 hypothetical protein [Aliarcobacter butzleri]
MTQRRSQETFITIDVKEEKSAFGNSFSLEIDLGYQFITQSRIFTDDEYRQLLEEEKKARN